MFITVGLSVFFLNNLVLLRDETRKKFVAHGSRLINDLFALISFNPFGAAGDYSRHAYRARLATLVDIYCIIPLSRHL